MRHIASYCSGPIVVDLVAGLFGGLFIYLLVFVLLILDTQLTRFSCCQVWVESVVCA